MSVSLTCPSCGARLRLADTLPRAVRAYTCCQCGARFTRTVRAGAAPPSRQGAGPPARAPARGVRPERGPQGTRHRGRPTLVLAACLLTGVSGLVGLAGGWWLLVTARSGGPDAAVYRPADPPPAGPPVGGTSPPRRSGAPHPAPGDVSPPRPDTPPKRTRPAQRPMIPPPARGRPPRPDEPYDGTGRYTMARDDGTRSVQGLKELARRFGVKPYADLRAADGTWQTERVVFRDVDTGATMVRLTNDPWADELSYFGMNWSADGQWVVFRRRPGMWEASTDTHGPMAVRSDGTGLRNVFRDYKLVHKVVCSPTDPQTAFALADGRKLAAFDLRTGKSRQVLREVLGCWHLKVSPDGKYLLGRGDLSQGGRGLWVASTDGTQFWEVPLPEAIHDSYQFHPSSRKIMFWYEGRYREGFVQMDLDGRGRAHIPVPFDWNHGAIGPDRGAHTAGLITRVRKDGWLKPEPLFHAPGVEYYDDPYRYNGYVTWAPRDQLWVYGTRLVRPPHLSEVSAFHCEPVPGDVVNRYRICYTGLRDTTDLDHPVASPDGTKVLFNANLFGRVDVYYVVARRPEAPTALRAARGREGVSLAWRPPAHHAEVSGYHVYRSGESGAGYVPITPQPVRGVTFLDPAPPRGPLFYAVSAVEHSGLEGGLSAEAAVDQGRAPRRLFAEAEQGERNRLMWVAHQGTASGLHYAWMRAREGEGRLTLALDVGDAVGPWTVWARVKGEEGAQFHASAGGQSATLRAPAQAAWKWMKFNGTLSSAPGRAGAGGGRLPLVVSSTRYGSAIDCLLLCEDAAFSPDEAPRVRWPAPAPVARPTATAVSPYAVKLSWPAARGDTLRHYNLYCGDQADFPVHPGTLVASPDRGPFVDWGLRPGTTYHYRVTGVDRAGNESPPSPPVQVRTPDVERVVVEPPVGRKIAFHAPREGVYALWVKLRKGQGGGQYLDLDVDGKKVAWTIAFDSLAESAWFNYDQWGRFPLSAGGHTLTIDNKTKHVVQKVLLTTDLSFKPDGHVNLLRGW